MSYSLVIHCQALCFNRVPGHLVDTYTIYTAVYYLPLLSIPFHQNICFCSVLCSDKSSSLQTVQHLIYPAYMRRPIKCRTHIIQIIMSIQKFILAMKKIETDFRTQIYFRMSFRTSFSSNKNYTIGSTRTINSRSTSIFHDLQRLDILRFTSLNDSQHHR